MPKPPSVHRRSRRRSRGATSRPVSPATYEACVAHQAADLRNGLTPLELLVGELERQLATGADEPAWLGRWAACLRASLDVMTAKVERVGAFPRVVPRAMALSPSTVDLASVVRDVCARRTADATASGAVLRVEAPRPVCGRWDRGGLHAIVEHLVSHAIGLSDRTPIDVAVGARGAHASVAVTESLPGGAAALGEGGGLELWPVRLLCEGMAGELAVRAMDDARARFTITLPLS